MRKVLFVLNPIAGSRKLRIDDKRIHRYFDGSAVEPQCVYTEYAGHGAALARAYKDKVDEIIAVGGDGSLNEIATQLVHTEVKLGIIPTGSGNGLARHVGIPVHSLRALEIIKEGCVQRIDVGLMNDRYFFSNAGLGIDANIIKRYNDITQRGWFTYGRLGVSEYFKLKPIPMHIDWGSGYEVFEAALVSVALSNQYGYNFKIAPDASIADGLFVSQAIPMLNPLQSIGFAFSMMIGKYANIKKAVIRHNKELKVKIPGRQMAQCDGEPVEVSDYIHFRILHKALNLIIPQDRLGTI